MPDVRTVSYPRRPNRDGSVASICPKCFATVATAMDSALLDAADKDHTCYDPA
jgi:hypothetical protein